MSSKWLEGASIIKKSLRCQNDTGVDKMFPVVIGVE